MRNWYAAVAATLMLCSCRGSAALPPVTPALADAGPRAAARAKTLFVSPVAVPGKLAAMSAASSGIVSPRTIVPKSPIANFGASYFAAYDPSHNRVWITSCVEVGLSGGPVVAFDADARGATAPDVLIVGKRTGLSGCQTGVATDRTGRAYVADLANQPAYPGGQVAVFGADQLGNAVPIRRIAGSATALRSPEGVALDASRNLYVVNSCQGFSKCTPGVNVYGADANGNVKPLRKIGGPATTMRLPFGIAVDSSGNLYVADAATNAIDVFAGNASGDAAPIRRIYGSKTKLRTPSGVAIDAAGYLYVGNFDESTSSNNWPVLVFALGADGNASPLQTMVVKASRFERPSGVALR